MAKKIYIIKDLRPGKGGKEHLTTERRLQNWVERNDLIVTEPAFNDKKGVLTIESSVTPAFKFEAWEKGGN